MSQDCGKRLIVVLGMHRSGTSVITKSLELFGIGLGGDLHPAGFDNPTGFWEDRECIAINEQLLAHLGSAYDRLDLAWDDVPMDSHVSALKERAIQLISRKIEENEGIWAFKDPRTCRLLCFWNEVFVALNCDVSFVVSVRNPVSVVASMKARNSIPAEKGYYLWLQHVLASLIFMPNVRRVVVDYDNFLLNPYDQIQRVSTQLALPIPARETTAMKKFESDFLDSNLRHTRYTKTDLSLDSRASRMVSDTYDLLYCLATDQEAMDSAGFRDRIGNLSLRLKEVSPAFDYINLLEDEKVSLYQAIAERDKQIEFLTIQVGDLQKSIAEQDLRVEDLAAQVSDLHESVAKRDQRAEDLAAQVSDLQESVAERDQRAEDLAAQVSDLQESVAKRDVQIISLNEAIAERDQSINNIIRSNSWIITKPLRYFRRSLLTRPIVAARKFFPGSARYIWRNLPVTTKRKQKLKHLAFNYLPMLFKRTNAYKRWISFQLSPGSQSRFPLDGNLVEDSHDSYIPLLEGSPLDYKPVKIICFYLPQFHEIPENNEWWGEGFTEWVNVRPAQPQFKGHYQPHVPGELGYYSLLDPSIQRRQVELARLYGVEGFCFYFYWFGGTILLEAPTENYLKDSSLDLPFCLCWANENWSRRWDGLDSEILMTQQHSVEDDLAFIEHVARYIRDPRYIHIDGKPLLLVYRPSLLPSAKKTSNRWRNWCRRNGIGEIYLAYTQSFELDNPDKYGFDAAIEFPPNNSAPPDITEKVTPLRKEFSSTVYDWRVFVERSEKYTQPDYKLFRSVCPSWDNTARRKNCGTIFLNSSPSLYRRWLENAINYTIKQYSNPDERLIFVNAWNEWAEGAHLEPDARYGYAYLQATRDALSNTSGQKNDSVLLVTHDCHPHGAQFLILETARQFKTFGFNVFILALGGGALLDEFKQIGSTLNVDETGEESVHTFLTEISSVGTVNAITSTVVSGRVVPQLKRLEFQVLSLIHELPGVIHDMKQEANAEIIAQLSDKVVFPADLVHELFTGIAPVASEKVVIRHQGVVRKNPYKERKSEAHQLICNKHNLPEDTQIVLSIAYMDSRKGPDLFVEIAAEVLKVKPKTTFIWVGHAEPEMEQKVTSRVQELGLQKQVLFVGFDRDPLPYYASASVYALTSREDPFPNVVLESVEASAPVVAFRDASGAGDFILEHGGRLANYLDTDNFASQVISLLTEPAEKIQSSDVSLRKYALDLMHYLNGFKRVSVVVPNYNYERYMTQRLDSIYTQAYPVYEVIVLDDASSDNSVNVIKKYIDRSGREAKLIVNDRNSGSVFLQWEKGVDNCKGDLVWIAEADDLAERDFLQELSSAFDDPHLVIGYSQSKQIDESGVVLAENYLEYSLSASKCCLIDYCRDGREEISKSLCIKNTIPNVSAVLFRRQTIQDVLAETNTELYRLHVAGDWLVYLHTLMKGKVYYSHRSLNLHRRHSSSVTNSMQKQHHVQEVLKMQRLAGSLVSLSSEKITAADEYIKTLCDQFELPYKKEIKSVAADDL